jgi:transcriptional regulator with XRE-family HTH domain
MFTSLTSIRGILGSQIRAAHPMIREDRFYEALGAAIKARREELGLTQAELGEHLQLSRTSVTNIERGRQRLLIDQFCRVAEVLLCTYDSLVAEAAAKQSTVEKKSMSRAVEDFVESETTPRTGQP